MLKEVTFPIPLKYIDVTRSTHTDLVVMQEKRVDDYWNVDSIRSLSDSWKTFTKFIHFIERKPPNGYMWSGGRLTKVQTTATTDHVWPEVWMKIGKAPQNREKQEWKNEKPKLDNARRLRGIYFIDPDDQDYKETLKKIRGENWKDLWQQPCRARGWFVLAPRRWLQCRKLHPNRTPKRFMVEKWNPMNPQGNEWKLLSLKIMKTTFAGKGFTSMTHYNLVHKFILMPQATKIADAKSALDKEWKKLETSPAWQLGKNQE